MPQTYDDNDIFEVAIMVVDFADNPHGTERIKEGDIVASRRGIQRIGTLERGILLWLRLRGVDSHVWHQFKSVLEIEEQRFDKRRYCIPLARLAQVRPDINMGFVREVQMDYQPDFIIDEETGNALIEGPVMKPNGLIYDKLKGDYI